MDRIDVHKLADEARFNGFHGLVLFWCVLIIIFDGYDLAVAGMALPSIMKDMGVSADGAGFMVSSALFGMMFGAIFLGTLADRIGRRPHDRRSASRCSASSPRPPASPAIPSPSASCASSPGSASAA